MKPVKPFKVFDAIWETNWKRKSNEVAKKVAFRISNYPRPPGFWVLGRG